jgi:hypothetical protein
VDGSADGVAIFAPAVALIENIDKNEAQLSGEFQRGQSRIFVSSDLLDGERGLADNLFVGLDESPDNVGIQIFSPQLREGSYLARKQEYLRNVESLLGLKRGMLSDANLDNRTATEIESSTAEYALTVMDFQNLWQETVEKTLALCKALAELYHFPEKDPGQLRFDWGNGNYYDQEKIWADYMEMVAKGMLKPEVALAWRFGLAGEDEAAIRQKYMPA